MVDTELRADAARRLEAAVQRMENFLLRSDRIPTGGDPTGTLAAALCEEARRLSRDALQGDETAVEESTLRSAYRLIGTLATLAAWSAPAAQESCAINSFPYAAARDVVAYARYGCAETTAQELACASLLGFDPDRSRVLLTSSGMAAYALIESFLLREVLVPDDRVLLHPGVYFETRDQLRSLPSVEIHVAAGPRAADLLAAIETHRPRVVFVDPLTNTADLRLLDIPRLLADADAVCAGETWFVIDGTLLSGGFDPFDCGAHRKVRVLYYESGCKYLQFGLDLGPAGVVVVEPALAACFELLRRGRGAIAPESLVMPRASRSAYLAFLRAHTASAEAAGRAVAAYRDLHDVADGHTGHDVHGGRGRALEAVFPTLATHPDHAVAPCYAHVGGVLVYRFRDARLNRREPLESFIAHLLTAAREAGVPLTAGVSFGFRVPRIGAAWSSYEAQDAFLRLSAGVHVGRATRLGELIARCAERFAARHVVQGETEIETGSAGAGAASGSVVAAPVCLDGMAAG